MPRTQQELLGNAVAGKNVLITTAAVPGKKAPVLVTEEMVSAMQPGSVIVDLAAERGGNCALTAPGQTVEKNGVIILGPVNLSSEVPYTASQLYAQNIANFLLSLIQDGSIQVDMEDEITKGCVIIRDGKVIHPKVKEAMG